MHKLILFIFLFSNSVVLAQNNAIIFVDYSGAHKKSSLISTIQNAALESNNFLLFISRGSKPIVSENKEVLENVLSTLYEPYTPPVVNYLSDLDSLNSIISNKGLLGNINAPTVILGADLTVYFFLNADDIKTYNQDYKIIDQFLLSNRLMSNNTLVNKCRVVVYIEKDNSLPVNIKSKFSTKNYELKYY